MRLSIILFFSGLTVCTVESQSVIQTCLSGYLPAPTGQQSLDITTVQTIREICRSTGQYVRCFENGLNSSSDPGDFFFSLIYDGRAMRTAYQGFCFDFHDIEIRIHCLLNIAQIQHCYDEFSHMVTQIGAVRNQVGVDHGILRSLACNVSVSRYQCESDVYRRCNDRAGEIMSNFYFAGLPVECQQRTGVSSLYTLLYSDAFCTKAMALWVLSLATFANL